MKTTLDYALEYCHKHYSVIPLVSKDKKPAINSWELNKTARADEKQIVQWFSNSENNIAIVTGRISSIIAFDIDGDAAKEQFFQRVEAFNDDCIKAAVKNAMRIRTGSGNTNIIIGFKPEDFAEGEEIKNAVLWGDNSNGGHSEIRLKAEGGYIVAPPSTHPNGNKYELVDGVSPAVLFKEQIQKLIAAINDDNKEKSYSYHNNTSMFYQLNDIEVANIVFVLKPYYHFGKRNDFVLYLSGWLRKKSVAIESANKVIQHIAEGDDEKSNRLKTLEDTYAKEDLSSVKGYSGLLEILTDVLQGDKKKASNILKKVRIILSAHRHLRQGLQGEGQDDKEPSIIEQASEYVRNKYKFVTIEESKDILYYKDGVYIPGGEVLIEKEAEQLFGYELSNKMLAEIKGHTMRKTYHSRSEFDADLNIINMKNGLYDIQKGEFKKHNPDSLSLNQIPILYNPKAKSKLFGKYLKEVLYPTEIRTAVELMAYTFYRDNPFEIITVLLGYGGNGKSVFTGLLTSLHGATNISNVPLSAMIKNTFALSDLENKDMNIDTELSSATIHDSAILKKLTGRQPIRIEQKNQRAYDALLHAKLFFSANKIPKSADDSDAYYRRNIILSFPNKFEGDREDQDLLKKLTTEEELSAIFNILIIAIRNILKNKKIFLNEKTIQERREKYELVSKPIECFKKDAIAEDSTEFDSTTKEDLYRAYEIFAKRNKLAIESKENFGKIIKHGFEEGREPSGRRKTFWRGVRLSDEYRQLIESEQQTLVI